MKYRKLTQPVRREGKGLHSGEVFSLSIEPSDEELSLEVEGARFPVSELALEGVGRGSDLILPRGKFSPQKRVRTCEHVLSALSGLGVWRAKLVVNGVTGADFEMPGLDGCAADLAGEIMEKSLPSDGPEPIRLQYPVYVGDSFRFAAALPSSSFHVTCVIDYDAAPIGTQIFDYDHEKSPEAYLREVASARTFAMKEDIEVLHASGLALGGSPDNAILVGKTSIEAKGGLRFPNEFARHKTLDLLGDLANVGRPLVAHVIAVRAGHVLHLQLVERLRALSRGLAK